MISTVNLPTGGDIIVYTTPDEEWAARRRAHAAPDGDLCELPRAKVVLYPSDLNAAEIVIADFDVLDDEDTTHHETVRVVRALCGLSQEPAP